MNYHAISSENFSQLKYVTVSGVSNLLFSCWLKAFRYAFHYVNLLNVCNKETYHSMNLLNMPFLIPSQISPIYVSLYPVKSVQSIYVLIPCQISSIYISLYPVKSVQSIYYYTQSNQFNLCIFIPSQNQFNLYIFISSQISSIYISLYPVTSVQSIYLYIQLNQFSLYIFIPSQISSVYISFGRSS